MIRFILFGFPVRVHWMFAIVCVIFGMGWLEKGGRIGILGFLISSVIVFVSILWHELGHAWARRKLKLNSEILLYGMGGLCGGSGFLTRKQTIFVAAMGPIAGLIAGGIIYALSKMMALPAPGTGTEGQYLLVAAIGMLLWVNIGWSLINLLPVLPLDGGRIFEALMANKKADLIPKVGMVVAGVVALIGLAKGMLFVAFLFGYLAYTNYQRLAGTHRGFF